MATLNVMNYSFTAMIKAEPISEEIFNSAKYIYNEYIITINKKYYNRIKVLYDEVQDPSIFDEF